MFKMRRRAAQDRRGDVERAEIIAAEFATSRKVRRHFDRLHQPTGRVIATHFADEGQSDPIASLRIDCRAIGEAAGCSGVDEGPLVVDVASERSKSNAQTAPP